VLLSNNGDEGNSLVPRSNNLHPDPLFLAMLVAFEGVRNSANLCPNYSNYPDYGIVLLFFFLDLMRK